jgi:hypothetical protein
VRQWPTDSLKNASCQVLRDICRTSSTGVRYCNTCAATMSVGLSALRHNSEDIHYKRSSSNNLRHPSLNTLKELHVFGAVQVILVSSRVYTAFFRPLSALSSHACLSRPLAKRKVNPRFCGVERNAASTANTELIGLTSLRDYYRCRRISCQRLCAVCDGG